MFDLDKSIAAWRRRFEHDSSILPEDLRELEQHVRDHVQDLVDEGQSVEEAFLDAVRIVGDTDEIREAYRTVLWKKLKRRERLSHHLASELSMLVNYVRVSVRLLRKQMGYTMINVLGLSLGIAVCLLIGLYVSDELSYDRFHADSDRIFRVVQTDAGGDSFAWSGPQMGLKLQQDFPQVESVMRFIDGGSGYGSKALISYSPAGGGGVKRFDEDNFIYADPHFFRFFSFPLINGDPESVLNKPGTVVVSESIARKYFGEDDAIGQVLTLRGQYPLEVTGVAADPPTNSHLTFTFVTSFHTFYAHRSISGEVDSFWWPASHTYVKLRDAADAEALEAALPAFVRRHRDADDAERLQVHLQPLRAIWLGPRYVGEQQSGGSTIYIFLFSGIALCILGLACVNFMNLATARAAQRAKEVSVRKVVGAARRQLIGQFLTESTLLSVSALVLACALAALMLPFFNGIAGTSLKLPFADGRFWLMAVGLLVTTALLAGCYPALYLSSGLPVVVMTKSGDRWTRGAGLRKLLVVFQFTISVILLVGTAVVYQQLRFVQHARLGFDQEHVIVLPGADLDDPWQSPSGETLPPRYETLKSDLLRLASVKQVTAVSSRPGMDAWGIHFAWEAEGMAPEENRTFAMQFVGDQFFEMLDLKMLSGRPLQTDHPADIGTQFGREDQFLFIANRAIVINEAASRRLGFTPEEAVGKKMRFYVQEGDQVFQDYRGTVVGVVQDYHTASLHEPISPVAYMPARVPRGDYPWLGDVLVKLEAGTLTQALHSVEEVWNRVVPERPFEPVFLKEALTNLYRADKRFGKLIGAFAILAVLIACLGLFGLAAFTAASRTKEIGVRKVLGASIGGIVALLAKDFLKLVVAAFVVAAPVAYYAADRWLEEYTYRIEPGIGLFLLAGALSVLIALLAVSYQSVKAALLDPVKSLRYE